MTRVTLRDLTKAWPGAPAPALDRLTLDIASGEMLALLGPSGCGKTTALRMIAGLTEPTSGEVLFDDRPVTRLRPEARAAVMVFQNHLLFPYLTVAENVGFGLRMQGLPRARIAPRVAAMLARVQLPDVGPRRPSELSGGQQQRVALARALILRPRVLLLDEPLSNLDASLRDEMRALIRGLQRETGITTIVVTHDQEEAVIMADRIALVLNGRLRQYDRPEAFYRRPASHVVARFFGARNFIPGRSESGTFHSPLGPLALPEDAPEGPGTLTIRPEAIRPGPAPENAPENALTMTVTERHFLGTRTRLTLTAAGQTLEATLPPDTTHGIEAGQEITLHLPRAALWVLPDA